MSNKKRKHLLWTDHKFSKRLYGDICSDIIDYHITNSKYSDHRDELMKQFNDGMNSILEKMPERMYLGSFILKILMNYGGTVKTHNSLNLMKYIFIPEILDVLDLFIFHHLASDDDRSIDVSFCYHSFYYRVNKYRRNMARFCRNNYKDMGEEQIKESWNRLTNNIRAGTKHEVMLKYKYGN